MGKRRERESAAKLVASQKAKCEKLGGPSDLGDSRGGHSDLPRAPSSSDDGQHGTTGDSNMRDSGQCSSDLPPHPGSDNRRDDPSAGVHSCEVGESSDFGGSALQRCYSCGVDGPRGGGSIPDGSAGSSPLGGSGGSYPHGGGRPPGGGGGDPGSGGGGGPHYFFAAYSGPNFHGFYVYTHIHTHTDTHTHDPSYHGTYIHTHTHIHSPSYHGTHTHTHGPSYHGTHSRSPSYHGTHIHTHSRSPSYHGTHTHTHTNSSNHTHFRSTPTYESTWISQMQVFGITGSAISVTLMVGFLSTCPSESGIYYACLVMAVLVGILCAIMVTHVQLRFLKGHPMVHTDSGVFWVKFLWTLVALGLLYIGIRLLPPSWKHT